jgi:hypothetical protein
MQHENSFQFPKTISSFQPKKSEVISDKLPLGLVQFHALKSVAFISSFN